MPVSDPELERRLARSSAALEAGAPALPGDDRNEHRLGLAGRDHRRDPGAGGELRGRDLAPHAAAAETRSATEPDRGRERAVVEQLRARRPRRARVDAVDLGEQHEQPGVRQDGDLSRQGVVVAEGDLVGGRRIVLVHDRDRPEPEQRIEGVADVDVRLPVGDVGG